MEDFLSLADADSLAKLILRKGGINGGHFFIVCEDAALLHKASCLGFAGCQLTGQQKI